MYKACEQFVPVGAPAPEIRQDISLWNKHVTKQGFETATLVACGPQGEPIFMRYSEDQPRDSDGKFASGGGPIAVAEQGGHAGGGVSSEEELARPGKHYIVDKHGRVTYHGKSFAPEETPPGGAHVTVKPNGDFQVNAGTLTESMKSSLAKAVSTRHTLRRSRRPMPTEQRYSEDQPHLFDGKFGSGSSSSPHEHEAVKQTGRVVVSTEKPITSTIKEGSLVTHIDAQGNKTDNHEAVQAHTDALAEHQKNVGAVVSAEKGSPEEAAALLTLAGSREKLADAHAKLLQSQGVKTDEHGRVPMKIGRATVYASYQADKSAMPNAMPTYHIETKGGAYIMDSTQHDVDRGAAKLADKGKRSLSQISETIETRAVEFRWE